jgi:hypothetical protein
VAGVTVQFFIAIFGVTAIYLSQQSHSKPAQRYACIFGLAAQPFWFATTYMNEQWGIFGLTFLYTYAWWKGFQNHWIKKAPLA